MLRLNGMSDSSAINSQPSVVSGGEHVADSEHSLTVDIDEPLHIGAGNATAQRRGVGNQRGRVLVLPPFGVPASALAVVADLLVAEHYEAILLDPRNSNGTGSGEISDFLMSTLIEDCRVAIEHYRPTVVVAVSLSARAAARALATSDHSTSAVFLLPVVDVRDTLTKVLGRDWFAVPVETIPEMTPVLGFEIHSEPFRADCVDLGILSPDSTRRDLEAVGAPVTLLPGTKDPWIDHATVTEIFDSVGSHDPDLQMRSLPCDQHELQKHPALAIRLIGECVAEVCGRTKR